MLGENTVQLRTCYNGRGTAVLVKTSLCVATVVCSTDAQPELARETQSSFTAMFNKLMNLVSFL